MAQIIEFPQRHKPLVWRFASKRSRILQALKFLFNTLRGQNVQPYRMIVIYELDPSTSAQDDSNKAVYYLNLGYTPSDFAAAVDEVMVDVKKRPDNWWA